ncbi:unannotated protein [freshwater metagenome]|uniref:Unannotated protein n=1 Tax=freshwater metagenome TaxID=449393 RepID=A0A6J7D0A8_9ZZZZ
MDSPYLPTSYRPDLQGIRALAVILVIFSHAGISGFAGGFIGVDIFFVLSGFVITSLLLRQPQGNFLSNLKVFYTRRILRILPAATLVLVVTPLAAFFLIGDAMDPALLSDVRWANLFAANWNLINNGSSYFVAGVNPSLVTHFWSLAVEEQFYILFPSTVFVFSYFKFLYKHKIYFQLFLIVIIAISAWWSLTITTSSPVEAYYSPFTRFWELAIGALIASVSIQLNKLMTHLFDGIGFALIILSLAILSPTSHYPGTLAWFPVCGTALLILTGTSSSTGLTKRFLSLKVMSTIGDLSYSLYLWHFIWIAIPPLVFTGLDPLWLIFLGIFGAVLTGLLSYHFLENPFRHSEKLRGDPFSVFILLGICLVLVWDSTLITNWLATR